MIVKYLRLLNYLKKLLHLIYTCIFVSILIISYYVHTVSANENVEVRKMSNCGNLQIDSNSTVG